MTALSGSGPDTPASEVILGVRDLVVEWDSPSGPVPLVDGVTFEVRAGEVMGIVGESGSGKSVTMLAVIGLLPPGVHVVSGEISFRGRALTHLTRRELSRIRGRDIGMVFQDALTSLNPVRTVGSQLAEVVRAHGPRLPRREVADRVHELLDLVGIPNPEAQAKAYPHQWSGGMRQRATIAMAMAHSPALLIADEATTALDPTIQAEVMDVLAKVRHVAGSAMALVTHDFGLVSENADRVAVMYGGRVMEVGSIYEVFGRPSHPYTAGLLASQQLASVDAEHVYTIGGMPPAASNRPRGCVFHPRCSVAGPECVANVPPLRPVFGSLQSACLFPERAVTSAPLARSEGEPQDLPARAGERP